VPDSEGHLIDDEPHAPRPVAGWEQRAIDAVGNVIEFWGFKRNQGRVWALLFLRDEALTAPQLQATLGLSKGAVSMITRELEQWQVVRRVRLGSEAVWRFEANADLLRMVNGVLSQRELAFIERVRADLQAAEAAAAEDPAATSASRARATQMRRLAELVEGSVRAFLYTAQLDISGLIGVLQGARRPQTRA